MTAAKKIYATKEEYLEAKRKRNKEYNQTNTTRIPINLNNITDQDILDHLATVPNRQGYIKDLIRKDMERRKDHNATEEI